MLGIIKIILALVTTQTHGDIGVKRGDCYDNIHTASRLM